MRETTFIDRNRTKWLSIESEEKNQPDEMASDFIDLTSDLSYAQSHYPHSKITSYLNFLASKIYKSIFETKSKSLFKTFWKTDFPLIIGHNRKVLIASSVFFILFVILGAICSVLEVDFIDSVLGSGYVEITENNIRRGKPFDIYASEQPLKMFLTIFSNNFFVGLIIYISGALVGIGTFYHTFKNGLMVGTFLTMFFEHNLGYQAFAVIMLHGTLELMGLVLETMAGLILGLSFLFPHTLTRWQAFKKGLIESGKIFIGVFPITLLAAFIESFITRLGNTGFQNIPLYISVLLIMILIASWVFIIYYFFIYSKKLSQKVPLEEYLKSTPDL
ncbi:MAG: stage II sporulation protein M [Cytophagaceae bacterium]|nr:stage II sporulation protein M [Cytophagaceae bacterium]MBL0302480.1 stage II sporulation protein M [Cytophagaceae bacterium]MBL0325307.1 stage II sporulation protein M [Cytophagaceae bacterium]